MKKQKQYRYIGRNGIITSRVLLEGINYVPMMYLEAAPGFILTDGTRTARAITVEAEYADQWYEIVDNIKKPN